jgi:hypothetical protein
LAVLYIISYTEEYVLTEPGLHIGLYTSATSPVPHFQPLLFFNKIIYLTVYMLHLLCIEQINCNIDIAPLNHDNGVPVQRHMLYPREHCFPLTSQPGAYGP